MVLMCWSLIPTALSPAQRGQLAVSQEELPQVLLALHKPHKHQNNPEHIQEIVLVSTCQRLEFYVLCEHAQAVEAALLSWCQQRLSLPPEALKNNPFYSVHTEDLAAQHLFQVASGLQSLSLGESEIMGQLRRAWNTARQNGTSGHVLNGLFSHALATGRKARHKTGIAKGTLSLESLALEHVSRHLQRPLSELRCLVIGTGQMGQAILRQLSHRQIENVRAINRSTPKTQQPWGFSIEPWSHLDEALHWAEAIIVCTAAPRPIITSAHFAEAGHPQVIIDLSLPANVEPGLGQARGSANPIAVYPLNILHQQLAQVQQRKHQGLKAVHYYISQGWESYLHWRKERALAPFLTAVYQRVPKTEKPLIKHRHLRQRLHPLVTALKQAETAHARAAYEDKILYLIKNTG